jgi:VWFA-related protein
VPAAASGHAIRLTAVVHDSSGNVSSALRAADFVIREKDEAHPITFFRNLRPPQQLIEKRPPSEYTVSNRPLAAFEVQQPVNVVVLDTRNTDPEFQPWLRGQALRFISLLRPDADIALYQFAASGLRLLHEFTHDKAELSKAVKKVTEPGTADDFEREAASNGLHRERYQETCQALTATAEYLGAFVNRKNLLWLAGDFPPVFEEGEQECRAMALALNKNNTAVYPVDVRSSIPEEPFQPVAPGDLQNVPRNRRRALSPQWLNNMATLAALTGGRAIRNRSQLAEAMVDAVNETRFAYELGFSLPETQCDGSLHPLNVGVKMRDAAVLAKQAFAADCDPQARFSRPSEPFDATGIGITVIPKVESSVTPGVRIKVLIAPSDLQWNDSGASVDVTAGDVKRTFPLKPPKKGEPAIIDLEIKRAARAQKLRVIVRDHANKRDGSVTLPLTTLESGL